MNFESRDSHSSPYSNPTIFINLKTKYLSRTYFTNKSFNDLLPPIFKSWFTFCSDVNNYQTVSSTSDKIFKSSYRTNSFGKNSITVGPINSWTKTQNQFSNLSLKTYNPSKIKSLLCKKCIENYQ